MTAQSARDGFGTAALALAAASLLSATLGGCAILRQVSQAQTITFQGRENPPDETRIYKRTPTRELRMHVFLRDTNSEPIEKLIPVLLVHGGGFTHGWPAELFPLAEDLARRGHVGFVPEYRIHSRDDTKVPEALSDVRDAIEWVHDNASDFAVDPEKLVLAGSSAGAYLVAAAVARESAGGQPRPDPIGLFLSAAYIDSTGVSARIAAERAGGPTVSGLLFGGPLDVFDGRSDELSPTTAIHRGLPPTLMQLGALDPLVPSARSYCDELNAVGGQCELKLHRGAGHAYALGGYPAYDEMVRTFSEAIDRWAR